MVDFESPDFWRETEAELYEDALERMPGSAGDRMADDEWLQFLYHEAIWDWEIAADQRQGVYQAFEQYVRDTYGLEWDDYFDWQGYRAAYDRARG